MDRVLDAMPPNLANAIRGAVVPSLWVPFDAVMTFIETIDSELGRGDLSLVRPLARYAARTNMPLLYRIFYKLGSVEFIASKAVAVWSAHYDSGAATSSIVAGGVLFSVVDFASPRRTHYLTILGWSVEIVSLCGA